MWLALIHVDLPYSLQSICMTSLPLTLRYISIEEFFLYLLELPKLQSSGLPSCLWPDPMLQSKMSASQRSLSAPMSLVMMYMILFCGRVCSIQSLPVLLLHLYSEIINIHFLMSCSHHKSKYLATHWSRLQQTPLSNVYRSVQTSYFEEQK